MCVPLLWTEATAYLGTVADQFFPLWQVVINLLMAISSSKMHHVTMPICNNCLMLSCQYGPKLQRNVSNLLLNVCHKELRQVWKPKGAQPFTSRLYLIKWPISVHLYIFNLFTDQLICSGVCKNKHLCCGMRVMQQVFSFLLLLRHVCSRIRKVTSSSQQVLSLLASERWSVIADCTRLISSFRRAFKSCKGAGGGMNTKWTARYYAMFQSFISWCS